MQVALTTFPGVSADECEAFTLAFEALEEFDVVRVGGAVGPVAGPGGGSRVDARFGEVPDPDIVLVPGGLGCARTATDDELLAWLRSVSPTWMAASSIGAKPRRTGWPPISSGRTARRRPGNASSRSVG
jgi:transcriptional regulator GlxA family with amidase domain